MMIRSGTAALLLFLLATPSARALDEQDVRALLAQLKDKNPANRQLAARVGQTRSEGS